VLTTRSDESNMSKGEGSDAIEKTNRPAVPASGPVRKRWTILFVAIILLSHCLLLGWSAYAHFPSIDEMGHLPAGVSHWHFGRFDLYRVNPPLVRMIAALPVVAVGPEWDWSAFSSGARLRPEFAIGSVFMRQHGEASLRYFTWARWSCIPLSLVGACYQLRPDARRSRRRVGSGVVCHRKSMHSPWLSPKTTSYSIQRVSYPVVSSNRRLADCRQSKRRGRYRDHCRLPSEHRPLGKARTALSNP
jgi:hypothetical protein